jgi:anti-sigma regulatory factor (Ser/Thr protein kinase)
MTDDAFRGLEGFDFLLEQGPQRPSRPGERSWRATALPDSVREDVLLLVTELVNNALRDARAGPDRPLRVELGYSSQLVRVVVVDGGGSFADEPALCRGDRSGWGLFLVDRIADRRGVTRTSSGNCVWFEIRYGA